MDAPKGRYSVVEKDGRLIVIDNGTGSPVPSSIKPPPRTGPGRSSSPAPVSGAGPGALDRAADLLVALAAKRWDADGKAVIAWTWTQNGRQKRWDAALDHRQQRRLGRALLALCAGPLFLFLAIVSGGAYFGFAILLALPALLWGATSLMRLYAETNDPGRNG